MSGDRLHRRGLLKALCGARGLALVGLRPPRERAALPFGP